MKILKLNKIIELSDVGELVCVYNGKKWVLISFLKKMVFYFIGEIKKKKKKGSIIHKKKKKIKKKNKFLKKNFFI